MKSSLKIELVIILLNHLYQNMLIQLLIKNNNKMKESRDKQNDTAAFEIVLDFKKKTKPKPNTDRTHNLASTFIKKQTTQLNPPNQNASLLEKKKQYSLAIREKNLTTNVKKVKNEYLAESDTLKQAGATETLKSNSLLLNQSNQHEGKLTEKDKSLNAKKLGKENQLKSKVRDAKREMAKIKKMSAAIEDFKSYGLRKWSENERTFASRHSEFDPDISRISKIQDFTTMPPPSKQLSISSLQISESIGPFVSEEMREAELLRRQNNTFKKELATFRKDNGTLKRELEQYKRKIEDLKEKNQFLSSQNEDNIKLLESFQLKVGETFQSFSLKEEEEPIETRSESNMKEILSSYESQLFEARSQVKKLEFRNYMLEKRLLDETQSHKKMMAREVSVWKERYIKARNQNLRMKDSRNSMLFEMSISQQM